VATSNINNELKKYAPHCHSKKYLFGRLELWRFFTYSLIHANLGHLLKNLFGLILVGIPLEMSHQSWRVALVYSLGVIAGSLGSTGFSEDTIPLTGSSGLSYFSCFKGHSN